MKGIVMTESDSENVTQTEDQDVVDTSRVTSASDVKSEPRRVSLSVKTLLVSATIVLLAVGLAVTTWLYFGERATLQAGARATANRQKAEQTAMDYAVNAAAMNFQDLNSWKTQLVKGTTPELSSKLSKAATSMEQLLVPLQWTSTAKPLTAKVRSEGDGAYVIDTFVSVLTKTTQAPDNLQSTATYSITLDASSWLITDVGGIGAVAAGK
ncbi:Uncharacterised protein [Mycobacteroides abscessus]|nr:Uncharacterised protein [Mycobacteroides abscessus]